MSDTPLVPCAQVARSNSAALLSHLAEVIRAEHVAIGAAVDAVAQDVLTHVLAAGRAALAAKELIPKDQFGQWVGRNCEVSWRHVPRYMKLTEAYEANATRVSHAELCHASFRGLMSLLTPPKKRKQGPSDKAKNSKPVAVAPLDPLSWVNASPALRAQFVVAVGWRGLLEVMPPDCRPAMAEWLQAQLSKETAVTIDQDGNVLSPTREEADRANGVMLPDDGSIPPFLDRTKGRSKEEINAERDQLIAESKAHSQALPAFRRRGAVS